MAHQFFFLCPFCYCEDSIHGTKCQQCGKSISFDENGVRYNDKFMNYPDFLKWMKKNLNVLLDEQHLRSRLAWISHSKIRKSIRISDIAVLRKGTYTVPFTCYQNLFRRALEVPTFLAKGYLALSDKFFYFVSPTEIRKFPIPQLSCVTTNSQYLEFKMRKEPFYQIHFLKESPLKYELIFQKLLDLFYKEVGKKVLEYQPVIKLEPPKCNDINLQRAKQSFSAPSIWQFFLELFLFLKLKIFFSFFLKLHIEGREYIPKTYPFIAIANHQSILDPFIILTYLKKDIGFLTKSTSFSHWFERFFLKCGRGIPTTRYQTDPDAIRNIVTFINHGISVGIFPEGERCWDGEIQAFKYSVIRLLLQLRVPIVPIIIENSFALMSRWSKLPKRQEVKLTVCAPFCLVPNLFSCHNTKVWLEQFFREILEK